MIGDGTFKIIFDEQWIEGVPAPSGRSAAVRADRFDPAEVRGLLDMVVDGTSLLDRPSEDSLFFLMRDLLSAAERITIGDISARVSFYEAPYELVLQRHSDTIYVTFYKGGQSPEVVVKDQRVSTRQFLRGVIASSRRLLEQAVSADESAADDSLIQWMNRTADMLESYLSERGSLPPAEPPTRNLVESGRWLTPRTSDGFSLGFRFIASSTDLLAPGRPAGNDLNALLFRGQFVIHARERRRVMGEGFLFLQTEKLLASVRKVLSAWEEGRPMAVRLISEGLAISVKLGSDDQLTVTLMNRDDDDSVVVLNNITPWAYADGILGVARELRRHILLQSSNQRRNIRLESLSREIRALVAWVKEQQREAIINSDVEPYRRQATPTAKRRATSELKDTNHLLFREKWRIEAEGLELDSTMLCEDVALVSARGFILGIEAESGAVLWRREVDRCDAPILMAGRDSFIRVAQTGVIDMVDLKSGTGRWQTVLAPRSGGSPVALVVDHGVLPGTIIVAEEERKLVALDLRTGEPKWRYTAKRGGRFSLRRHGRLLYVSSSDTQFTALDIESGEVVWMFPERTMFQLPAAIHEDTLIVPGGRFGKTDGRLFGVDAFSGESRWSIDLEGGAMTAPILSAGVAMIPVRKGRQTDLAAFDVATGQALWRTPCDGWAETCSLLAGEDQFIVNVAGGTIRAIDARTGEERWNTVLGPTCSDDIPIGLSVVQRGGVLFVPADTVYLVDPQKGSLIHGLGGDPPVPDHLSVNDRCSVFVAEESGHIAFYELTRRFAVVDGGR